MRKHPILRHPELTPQNARAVGEVEPVRVFESAEAAMAFLTRAGQRQ